MAYGITSKPVEGLGNTMRSFVDDISATTQSNRVYYPITRKPCIVIVHAKMAGELARGIARLKGKISPKTAMVGTSLGRKRLLLKDLKNLALVPKLRMLLKILG